jgi:hypothetical protein
MRKLKFTAITIIYLFLLSGITPIISNYINAFFLNLKQSNAGGGEGLYLDEVSEISYYFIARGPYYMLVEIEDTDFTYFIFDEEIYEVSYGFNYFPIKFPNNYQKVYQLEIEPENLEFFKSITVEPLFIAEDRKEVNLNSDTEINFKAGGPISILTRPTFAYNLLYLEVQNENGGSTLLKRIQDGAEYPEIDPLFYCLFIERGTYIRYDINLEPGDYKLLLKGDGLLDYKIMVNLDWDEDEISDVDEIQQSDRYYFDLDPTYSDTWGFFEKADENLYSSQIQEEEFTNGFFSFFLPDISYSITDFSMKVISGEFKEIIIDGNATIFKNDIFVSNSKSPPLLIPYGSIGAGWHHVSYIHKANRTSEIEFLINNVPIKVLKFPELRDTDGDGVKDLAEYSNSLDPSKVDTDGDGIPDNYDNSPLAKFELNPNEINQIVVPTDQSRDTIINVQIEKPAKDYSTYGTPRLWRGELNVSIYPVLRMFGNKYQGTYGRYDMNRNTLGSLWGKNVELLFKSDENYNDEGVGDPLPNPSDPNSEYYFIFPKPSLESFDFSIMIPNGHGSKTDGFLDLRFDFIWIVTHYDSWEKRTSILHFYDFDDTILVQSMGMREVSNANYILGSPDCFIDNQILWTITQNPNLGTPEEFGVDEDIIGQGNVKYFNLPTRIAEDRNNHPIEVNEAEVLYIAGSYQNYDILNKIHLKKLINPEFAEIHQGDYEAFFSSFIVSNLYEDQNYFLDDSEIQGGRNILYQKFHFNDVEERVNILSLPISMELSANAKVLKISQAQGINIPVGEIPLSDSNLNPEITILHQTFIEGNTQNPGKPLINFEDGVDIYKEYIDNRQDEVVLSDLFFQNTTHTSAPVKLFQNFIDKYWDQYDSFLKTLDLLYKNITSIADQVPVEDLENRINNIINKINIFKLHSYSEESYYDEFFQITQNLETEISYLISTTIDLEFEFGDIVTATGITVFATSFGEEFAAFSEGFHEQIAKGVNDNAVKADPKQCIKVSNNKEGSFTGRLLRNKLSLGITGGICVAIGVVMTYYAIIELITLSEDLGDTEFGIRIAKALATVLAGVILTLEGILLVASAFSSAWAVSLSSAIKFFGYAGAVFAVVIYIFDLALFIEKLVSKDYNSLAGEIFNFLLSTAGLVSCLLIVFGSTAATGVGVVLGVMVAAVLIFMAIWEKKMNDPNFTIEDTSGPYLSSETKKNIRRHGGLEAGDFIDFALDIDNSGKNPLWIRARFRVVGEYIDHYWVWEDDHYVKVNIYEWVGDWSQWKGPWDEDIHWWIGSTGRYSEDFTAQIKEPSLNLNYELEIQVDYEYSKIASWERKDLTDQVIVGSLNMPAFENTISDFYSNTTEFSYESLLLKINSSLENYRYKDAFNAVNDVISGMSAQISQQNKEPGLYGYADIPLDWFLFLEERVVDIPGSNYYFLDVLGNDQTGYLEWPDGNPLLVWESLIRNFFDSGFRATVPFPLEIYIPGWTTLIREDIDPHLIRPLNPTYLALYPLHMIIPKTWIEDLIPQLSLARNLLELRDSLPLKTNIRTDINKTIIEDDPISGIVNIGLKLFLDGPDHDKQVKFEIIPPEGFSISPQNNFTGRLDSTIHFTFIRETALIEIKGYYYDLKIYLGSDLIFQDSVPFKFSGFSRVEIDNYSALAPIVPGEIFNAIIVSNTGTYPEILNISVTGSIPDSFIYKGFYPDNFTGNTLMFMFYPGESKTGLAIKPPRHYNTKPGSYDYTIRVLDIVNGIHDILFSDTFEIAEFYDMNFELVSIVPDDTIFDYQEAIYTFNLTNLGNVNQLFHISYDDVTFANEALNKNDILLEPGEWQLVTLTLNPTGWINQTFNIIASSEHNSSTIVANISIIDDDTNPPEFINFEIIETPISLTLNFDVLNENEGDDYGLSHISIFIDESLVQCYIPDDTEKYFSFTFNDTHGSWFTEYGIHNIRIEAIDNDFDVPNDELISLIFGTFETTLEDVYNYIYWQMEMLKEYISNNVYSHLGKIWIHKLCCAQKQLEKAFNYVENDRITCGLFHDAVAKVLVQIIEFKTYFFERYGCIDENIAQYIAETTQIIRNNIVLLMGYTTGTNTGYKIALVEIDLLNLKDLIEEEIISCHKFRWYLKNLIRTATFMLESAIIKISMGYSIECCLHHALYKLKKAECQVIHLVCQGELTQELADIILFKLNQAQQDITAIFNSI